MCTLDALHNLSFSFQNLQQFLLYYLFLLHYLHGTVLNTAVFGKNHLYLYISIYYTAGSGNTFHISHLLFWRLNFVIQLAMGVSLWYEEKVAMALSLAGICWCILNNYLWFLCFTCIGEMRKEIQDPSRKSSRQQTTWDTSRDTIINVPSGDIIKRVEGLWLKTEKSDRYCE